jgi:AcrR family transcriptional regulator
LPTPAKTSREELIALARRLVDADGPEALTVSAVAQSAGVKAPSLYKHFADRDALLKAVEIDVLHELEATLRMGTKGTTPRARLTSMAASYRDFAREQPHRYAVIYSRNVADDPELAAACLLAARPLFEELERAGVAAARILPLARTLTAFLHGFVSMEIVNAFRLGGSVGQAFDEGLETILGEVRPQRCRRARKVCHSLA